MIPKAAPLWRRFSRPLLALLAAAALVCMLAFLGEGAPQASQVCPAEGEVLLLGEWDGACCLVTSAGDGAGLYTLNSSTGEVLEKASLSHPVLWAALRGGSLYTLENQAGTLRLSRRGASLEISDSWPLPIAPEEISLSGCDGTGVFYFTSPENPASLRAVDPHGAQARKADFPGPGAIQFLATTPGDRLYLFAGGSLHFADAPQLSSWSAGASLLPPTALLGEDAFLDAFGRVCRWEGGAFVQKGTAPADPLLSALDGEGRLLTASGSQVTWSTLEGETLGSARVQGEVRALCGGGVLSQEGGQYLFTPGGGGQGSTPTPSPSPSPTPSPSPPPAGSPSPSPSATPSPSPSPSTPEGIAPEGEWLLAPAGTTVEDLAAWYAPDTILVRDLEGQPVSSGALATGMSASTAGEEFLLVVPGDCDGNGAVNRQDLKEAQALLLEGDGLSTPYRRAADLDGDGALTTQDLALLSQKLS